MFRRFKMNISILLFIHGSFWPWQIRPKKKKKKKALAFSVVKDINAYCLSDFTSIVSAFPLLLSLCLCLSPSVSVVLTHTHTHSLYHPYLCVTVSVIVIEAQILMEMQSARNQPLLFNHKTTIDFWEITLENIHLLMFDARFNYFRECLLTILPVKF